tara:strand:+ start:382 stop:612 length:231 start_codon:yes stop_codon:yes gene_type:complete
MEGIEFNGKVYDDRHGGPFDRGAADSYYRRGITPHFFTGSTNISPYIDSGGMTDDELDAYHAGYRYNQEQGDFKEW